MIKSAGLIGVCSALALLALPLTAAAQVLPGGQGAASGQVEQSLRNAPTLNDLPVGPLPTITIEEKDLREGAAAETAVTLRVERFEIEGNTVFTDFELYSALGGVDGRVGFEMSLLEIKFEAKKITQHYRDHGYALAWAFVPEQKIEEGVVLLSIVEGSVDKILLEGNSYYTSEFILSHVDAVQKPGTMDLSDLERGLLMLNEYGGLKVSATLRPGESRGTTDLYLQAEDEFPVQFTTDFDNYGSESVGENRLGAGIDVFNLFEAGHSLSLRGVWGLDAAEGELGYGRIGYEIPFANGTKLSVYGSLYDYEAKGDVTILDPTGNGTVFGGMITQPVVKNHTLQLDAGIGFEAKNLEQELLGFTTGEDRLRLIIGQADFKWNDDFAGRWVATGWVRQGLGEVAGGLEDDDPDASRLGADGEFTVWQVLIYRLQRVTSWFYLIGKGYGQYANEELVVSEQIAIGGHDSVRGYAPFEFMGDRGYTASLEGRIKLPFLEDVKDPFDDTRSIVDMVQLAAFIDHGQGVINEPAFQQREKVVLSGAGVGMRINYPDRLSIRLDVAWPLSDPESATGDDSFFYLNIILNLN